MKKFKLFTLIVFLLMSVSSYSQLKVNSSGNVGIGAEPDNSTYDLRVISAKFSTTESDNYPYLEIINIGSPNYKLFRPSVNNTGSIGSEYYQFNYIFARYHYAQTVLLTSDRRLKENFSDIEKPLEKLLQVKGLKYDFINQGNDSLLNDQQKQEQADMRKDRLGFVAQDLEKLFPEAVLYDKDADKYYIEYNAIIPVIVEAMKEQQAQIEELKSELASCCEGNLKVGTINNSEDLNLDGTQAQLDQNIPNPFNQETQIGCFIPDGSTASMLYIYTT
ncbi:MAG: tail fiber domain-containing protein [Prolixibacteraceae bacterium]|nr:tail fiber domain-containing protein [Prolixibacteraceae bacterium]